MEEFLEVVKQFMIVEKNWIPKENHSSYYIRPMAMSLTNKLGVFTPAKTAIYIMGGPVSAYFQAKEISLKVDENYHRNTPKNCGGYKIAANYGPTVKLTALAEKEEGCSQLIWTYDEMLLESGASNIFFVFRDSEGKKLVTHPDDGLVLPGVTRSSIIALAEDVDKDIKVETRPIKIQELIERHQKN